MGYVSTRMKKEINIESIVTIHYFEYMKISSFKENLTIFGNYSM